MYYSDGDTDGPLEPGVFPPAFPSHPDFAAGYVEKNDYGAVFFLCVLVAAVLPVAFDSRVHPLESIYWGSVTHTRSMMACGSSCVLTTFPAWHVVMLPLASGFSLPMVGGKDKKILIRTGAGLDRFLLIRRAAGRIEQRMIDEEMHTTSLYSLRPRNTRLRFHFRYEVHTFQLFQTCAHLRRFKTLRLREETYLTMLNPTQHSSTPAYDTSFLPCWTMAA